MTIDRLVSYIRSILTERTANVHALSGWKHQPARGTAA